MSLKFKDLLLNNRVIYSPLAGCSDFPFRKMAQKYSPGLMFCEMVKMDALVRHDPNTYHILDYDASMHPIGGQLCGSKKEYAGVGAKIIEDLGFDVVDLNCGCPVDKVTKDGSGSGLLKTPELIGELVAEMVKSVSIPVTVKVRAGWDESSINAHEITKIAESAGAAAIFIHGRTRKQAYRGPADWSVIKESKVVAKDILVIGNGDVFSPEAAQSMLEQTACDGVLASRGTMGKPWLARDIVDFLEGKEPIQATGEVLKEALLEHFSYMLDYYCERRVCVEMRRVGCWYVKKGAQSRDFRFAMSRVESVSEIKTIIKNWDWSGV